MAGRNIDLHFACHDGDVARAQAAIDAGADVNDGEGAMLTSAAAKGNPEVTRLLLEHGADADRTNDLGYTPLHYAAQRGYLEVVRLLLVENGADVDRTNKYGRTPLDCATRHGHDAMARLFREHAERAALATEKRPKSAAKRGGGARRAAAAAVASHR